MEEKLKTLLVGKTKIGSIESKVDDEIVEFDILYGNVASPMINKQVLRLPREAYYKMVEEFLDSDEGLEYEVPSEKQMQDAINEITRFVDDNLEGQEEYEEDKEKIDDGEDEEEITNMQENGESDEQKEDDDSSLLDELEDEEEAHPTESKKESSSKRVEQEPEPKEESEENLWYDEYKDDDKDGFLDEIEPSDTDSTQEETSPASLNNDVEDDFVEVDDPEDNTDTTVVSEDAFKEENNSYFENETSEYKFIPEHQLSSEFAKKGVVALNNKNAQQLVEMIGRLAMIEQASQDRMEELQETIRKKERHTPLKYGAIAFLFYLVGMIFTYFVIH